MRTRLERSIAAAAFAFAAFVIPRVASATPNFPDAIKTHLVLAAPPPCAICHNGGITGRGTVTTPFGKSMRAHGLVAFDETSLVSALDQLASGKVDSLGDGTVDIDDLKAGRDPNAPDGDGGANVHVDTPVIPAYGCGAHVAPTNAAGDPWGVLGAVIVGGALLVSRTRRSREI